MKKKTTTDVIDGIKSNINKNYKKIEKNRKRLSGVFDKLINNERRGKNNVNK